MSKLDNILNKLARNNCNKDLGYAIRSWCNVVSQLGNYDPHKIEYYAQQWLNNNYIFVSTFEFYKVLLATNDKFRFGAFTRSALENISQDEFKQNIEQAKNRGSIKIVLLIAFVLTGVGLLLFLLNKKDNNSREYKEQSNAHLSYRPRIQEKYILTLLINSDRNKKLIQSLKNSSYLKPEDSRQLYNATQALWIGSKSEFERSKIKTVFNKGDRSIAESEYDVYFVSIELNEIDLGFKQNANQMDRIDAFKELANKADKITVSERLLSKTYENTEFYSR